MAAAAARSQTKPKISRKTPGREDYKQIGAMNKRWTTSGEQRAATLAAITSVEDKQEDKQRITNKRTGAEHYSTTIQCNRIDLVKCESETTIVRARER